DEGHVQQGGAAGVEGRGLGVEQQQRQDDPEQPLQQELQAAVHAQVAGAADVLQVVVGEALGGEPEGGEDERDQEEVVGLAPAAPQQQRHQQREEDDQPAHGGRA